MIIGYLSAILIIALSVCGVTEYVFADAASTQSQYVGKYIVYELDSSTYVQNKLVYSVSGQIKYDVVSFDSKSGEFTLNRLVDLQYDDGTKLSDAQKIHSRLNHQFSLFDIASYVDPLFPGKTELALTNTKSPSSYELSIIKRDLLEQQIVLNNSVEPTLVYSLKSTVKTFDQTVIPSEITLDLKSVNLEGVKDKEIYDAVLEDYGSIYDYYKNMKFSLKITAVDSNFKNDKATEPTKPKAATQDSKSLLYENKQYGFSMRYPSGWQIQELAQKVPNSTFTSIVKFTPSKDTVCGIGLSENNSDYKGLGEKQFLAKMKKQVSDMCSASASSGVTCSEITTSVDTHKNGYKMYNLYYAVSVQSEKGTVTMIEATTYIPDGNDIWSLQVFSMSPSDLENIGQELGSSLDSFKIYDYTAVKSKAPQKQVKAPKTVPTIKSDAGTLQLNSEQFSISKYSKTEIIVSGKVTNYQQGVPLSLKILKPGGTVEEQRAMVTHDGNYKSPLRVGNDWQAGTYTITAIYGSQVIGSVSFQVIKTN
jgi:hypothetical protein